MELAVVDVVRIDGRTEDDSDLCVRRNGVRVGGGIDAGHARGCGIELQMGLIEQVEANRAVWNGIGTQRADGEIVGADGGDVHDRAADGNTVELESPCALRPRPEPDL